VAVGSQSRYRFRDVPPCISRKLIMLLSRYLDLLLNPFESLRSKASHHFFSYRIDKKCIIHRRLSRQQRYHHVERAATQNKLKYRPPENLFKGKLLAKRVRPTIAARFCITHSRASSAPRRRIALLLRPRRTHRVSVSDQPRGYQRIFWPRMNFR
jgi:hypothetical protein